MLNWVPPQKNYLTYTPGKNVKLINKAEYCKSIIADGKELITGNESGGLIVPELKDEKVYITFNGCSALAGESPYTMIDDQKVHLYERPNYPEHFTTPTSFSDCFMDCTGLTDFAQIPTDWK